jgi:hypothetical protein
LPWLVVMTPATAEECEVAALDAIVSGGLQRQQSAFLLAGGKMLEKQLTQEIEIINRTLAAFGVDAGTRPSWTTVAGLSFVAYGLRTGPAPIRQRPQRPVLWTVQTVGTLHRGHTQDGRKPILSVERTHDNATTRHFTKPTTEY